MQKIRPGHKLSAKQRTTDVLTEERVDFESLLLSPLLIKGLTDSGFEKPSPIQLKAIPLGRCGLDLIAQAKSGTGKTCVFSVIALESINTDTTATQVLILAPTREIAVQVKDVVNAIGCHIKSLSCQVFIGGLPLEDDKKALKGCHVAVGSPGRVKYLIENKHLKTDSIRMFILDEADKLLDESFQEQINWIYSTLPANKQMMAFSATYPEYLANHLTRYMREPTFVRLNAADPTLQGIKQFYCTVPFHHLPHKVFQEKVDHLLKLLSKVNFHQCLLFSNYQIRAQSLSCTLCAKGWPATFIAGNQSQQKRLQAMEKLKDFKCRILISTDLTARGIDAENVNLVVNMDIPRDGETYLHRIGRAGRFGTKGVAVTFVAKGKEEKDLKELQESIGISMELLPESIPESLMVSDSPSSQLPLKKDTIEVNVLHKNTSKTSKPSDTTTIEATDRLVNGDAGHLISGKDVSNNLQAMRNKTTQQPTNGSLKDGFEYDCSAIAREVNSNNPDPNIANQQLGEAREMNNERRNLAVENGVDVQKESSDNQQVNSTENIFQNRDISSVNSEERNTEETNCNKSMPYSENSCEISTDFNEDKEKETAASLSKEDVTYTLSSVGNSNEDISTRNEMSSLTENTRGKIDVMELGDKEKDNVKDETLVKAPSSNGDNLVQQSNQLLRSTQYFDKDFEDNINDAILMKGLGHVPLSKGGNFVQQSNQLLPSAQEFDKDFEEYLAMTSDLQNSLQSSDEIHQNYTSAQEFDKDFEEYSAFTSDLQNSLQSSDKMHQNYTSAQMFDKDFEEYSTFTSDLQNSLQRSDEMHQNYTSAQEFDKDFEEYSASRTGDLQNSLQISDEMHQNYTDINENVDSYGEKKTDKTAQSDQGSASTAVGDTIDNDSDIDVNDDNSDDYNDDGDNIDNDDIRVNDDGSDDCNNDDDDNSDDDDDSSDDDDDSSDDDDDTSDDDDNKSLDGNDDVDDVGSHDDDGSDIGSHNKNCADDGADALRRDDDCDDDCDDEDVKDVSSGGDADVNHDYEDDNHDKYKDDGDDDFNGSRNYNSIMTDKGSATKETNPNLHLLGSHVILSPKNDLTNNTIDGHRCEDHSGIKDYSESRDTNKNLSNFECSKSGSGIDTDKQSKEVSTGSRLYHGIDRPVTLKHGGCATELFDNDYSCYELDNNTTGFVSSGSNGHHDGYEPNTTKDQFNGKSCDHESVQHRSQRSEKVICRNQHTQDETYRYGNDFNNQRNIGNHGNDHHQPSTYEHNQYVADDASCYGNNNFSDYRSMSCNHGSSSHYPPSRYANENHCYQHWHNDAGYYGNNDNQWSNHGNTNYWMHGYQHSYSNQQEASGMSCYDNTEDEQKSFNSHLKSYQAFGFDNNDTDSQWEKTWHSAFYCINNAITQFARKNAN